MKSAFFLRWPIDPTASPGISLICFGGHMVINRLQTLTYSAVKNGIIHDPLSLFVVILNRLSAHMNNAVWDLSKVFAGIETVCTPL